MHKIKKKSHARSKQPVLYNIIEDYTEWDPPGNVTVCAMTASEDIFAHARVLSESYEIPADVISQLLTKGGLLSLSEKGAVSHAGPVCL